MSSESAHMGSVLDCTIVLTATPRPGAEHAREGSEKSFPCLLPIFGTRAGHLSNPGQHGGAGASLEGCWQTLHACALGAKRPFGPRSRTSKVDFTPTKKVCRLFCDLPSTCEVAFKPAKTVARIFVDPCLCSAGFISGPACLRRACKTPPQFEPRAAPSTWRLKSLHKVDKMQHANNMAGLPHD